MYIAPSILNCTEENLHEYLVELESIGIKYIHLDIMDGKFVPATTKLVERMNDVKGFNFINDVHLMVINPSEVYRDYGKCGADYITFHIEAQKNPTKLISKIHSMGKKVGISIKPNTNVDEILEYLPLIDLVLVMSVEPGAGGQKFMPESLDKVRRLAGIREQNLGYKYLIEVDGGINRDNVKLLEEAGCDICVIGTALLRDPNKKEFVQSVQGK